MKVMFRIFKAQPQTVIALLPEVTANYGKIVIYEQVGQHGEGDAQHIIRRTRPAKSEEYESLAAELGCIYEELIESIKRLPRR